MTLFDTVSVEARGERGRLVAAACIAGAANAGLLFTINQLTDPGHARDVLALVRFVELVALYVLCNRYVNRRTTVLIEAILHRIKVRVGDKVARSELSTLERVGAAEICDRITDNTTLISERAGTIANLGQALVVLAFSGAYIASISLLAAALITLLCSIGAVMFVNVRQNFIAYSESSSTIRITFLQGLSDLLSGFKEVQFSRQRGREIGEHIMQSSGALRDVEAKSNNLLADGMLIGEGVLFALLAAVVYAMSVVVKVDAPKLTQLVATVMFIWGPFQRVTSGIMPYLRSNLALGQIAVLEQKLELATANQVPPEALTDPWQGRLHRIEARSIEYSYVIKDGRDHGETFHIGPIDLTIEAGQVVFIVGGNGSGKSTFLKVLTGLYQASDGTLRVDGVAVDAKNVGAYRNLISAIFSDFHLFPKLYGLAGFDEAAVHKLLVQLQLADKTAVVGRAFTKLTLSTGQKKRLAMIVSLLEDRPICVFDEWAADQDPEFRRYFYEELLPLLRQEGKIVLVVSHDDRYFACADRVVTMEYGLIRSIADHRPAVANL